MELVITIIYQHTFLACHFIWMMMDIYKLTHLSHRKELGGQIIGSHCKYSQVFCEHHGYSLFRRSFFVMDYKIDYPI